MSEELLRLPLGRRLRKKERRRPCLCEGQSHCTAAGSLPLLAAATGALAIDAVPATFLATPFISPHQ